MSVPLYLEQLLQLRCCGAPEAFRQGTLRLVVTQSWREGKGSSCTLHDSMGRVLCRASGACFLKRCPAARFGQVPT
eukprot:1483825-Amphidinium_carterae.1